MSLFRWIVLATLAGAVSDEPAKVPASNGYVAEAVLTPPSSGLSGVSDEGIPTLDDEPRVEIGEAIVRIYDVQGRVIAVQ